MDRKEIYPRNRSRELLAEILTYTAVYDNRFVNPWTDPDTQNLLNLFYDPEIKAMDCLDATALVGDTISDLTKDFGPQSGSSKINRLTSMKETATRLMEMADGWHLDKYEPLIRAIFRQIDKEKMEGEMNVNHLMKIKKSFLVRVCDWAIGDIIKYAIEVQKSGR